MIKRSVLVLCIWLVLAADQGVSLGQVATEEKSNEITAIPELLAQLNLQDAIVTIGAIGYQKEITQKILDGDGNYVLAVKQNQPKLDEAVGSFFESHWKDVGRRILL